MIENALDRMINIFIREKKYDLFLISVVILLLILSNSAESLAWRGKVVDKTTGKPIEGAVIVRSWDRETATPAGGVSAIEDVKEVTSDEKGEFTTYGKLFFGSIPFLSVVNENKPIIYKPGYKFLVLEDKTSTILLESVPTVLSIRKAEAEKARNNYEIDYYETKQFKLIIEREEEFVQFKEFIDRRRLFDNNRQLVRQRIIDKLENRKITSGKRKKFRDAKEAEHLINALHDENLNVRKNAADRLGEIEITDPSQLAVLKTIAKTQIEGWDNKSKDVKIIPVVNLGMIGTPVVETLLEALKHENKDVRWRAAFALAETQDARSIEPLIAALEDKDPYVREQVVWSLRISNEHNVIKHLIDALNDKSAGVRRSAAGVLGEIADPAAIKPLINALRDETDYVRNNAEIALINIGDAAVDDLIGALGDDDWRVREKAAYILTYTYDDRVVVALIKALNDKNSEVLGHIAFALGEFRDPRAVESLISILKNDVPNVRRSAADALGKIQDPKAIEPLISALKDPEQIVRKSVIEALGMMQDKRVVQSLIGAWNDQDSDIRKTAAAVLVNSGSIAVEPLINVLKHKDSYFRWRAAWALGEIRDPKAAEYLTTLLQDKVSEVRFISTEALDYIRLNRLKHNNALQ